MLSVSINCRQGYKVIIRKSVHVMLSQKNGVNFGYRRLEKWGMLNLLME
jgi:hypothetical protein